MRYFHVNITLGVEASSIAEAHRMATDEVSINLKHPSVINFEVAEINIDDGEEIA